MEQSGFIQYCGILYDIGVYWPNYFKKMCEPEDKISEHEVSFTADADRSGDRIDSLLADELPELSRSYIQKIIKDGGLLVNGEAVRASYRLRENDEVSFSVPENREPEILPEDIPLDILYEDDDLLVVNKPKGMVVHPAAGHYEHTLVNALLFHCRGHLSGINGILRPGIVHRIDRDTTGALVVCKTDTAHRALSEQLAVHSITRRYRAICHGDFSSMPDARTFAGGLCAIRREDPADFPAALPDDLSSDMREELHPCFRIEGNIGRSSTDRKKMAVVPPNKGKTAVTHVRVLSTMHGYSYIECVLETGRTHQIRVHLSTTGHPLLGDEVYGPAHCPVKGLEGQTLHAMILGFIHPSTGSYVEFEAPLPEYFQKLLVKLRH
jgi:23S rRNA pseudouridine1911/1915/1917 synthase